GVGSFRLINPSAAQILPADQTTLQCARAFGQGKNASSRSQMRANAVSRRHGGTLSRRSLNDCSTKRDYESLVGVIRIRKWTGDLLCTIRTIAVLSIPLHFL